MNEKMNECINKYISLEEMLNDLANFARSCKKEEQKELFNAIKKVQNLNALNTLITIANKEEKPRKSFSWSIYRLALKGLFVKEKDKENEQ